MLKGSTVKEVNVCCRKIKFTVVAWSMFSQRKTECHPTVIPFHGTSTYDLVCWGKLLESMNCFAASMWRFLCAKQWKCSSVDGRKTTNERRKTNDERTDWLVRIFAIWLVRIPIDWYEFRTIGPNFRDLIGTSSDRLVRIPNDWSKFQTNDEWRVRCCDQRERVWRSEICQSVKCRKKIGVDWPRQSQFQKICQTVNVSKLKNRRGLV